MAVECELLLCFWRFVLNAGTCRSTSKLSLRVYMCVSVFNLCLCVCSTPPSSASVIPPRPQLEKVTLFPAIHVISTEILKSCTGVSTQVASGEITWAHQTVQPILNRSRRGLSGTVLQGHVVHPHVIGSLSIENMCQTSMLTNRSDVRLLIQLCGMDSGTQPFLSPGICFLHRFPPGVLLGKR